jgi:CheY-like chemotaxis protein
VKKARGVYLPLYFQSNNATITMALKVTKFLLADDDRDDRDMFTEALADLDPQIVCHNAEDGSQALKLLSTVTDYPNIIFLDINMPVMDGWTLLRNLKRDDQFTHIPVVVYSTSSREKDRETARDLGAMCFVTKPDSFKMVKSMLEIVVSHLHANKIAEMCGQIHNRLNI